MEQNKVLMNVKRIAILFFFIGAIGLFVAFLAGPYKPSTELPNSEPHGIVLDKKGNIYCGSKFYGRIQKYGPDGKFIRGFDTHGGIGWGTDFGFYLDESGYLCIQISGIERSSKDILYKTTVYDHEGAIIRTEEHTKPGIDHRYRVKNNISDSIKNTYDFKGFLFPRVIKQTKDGTKSVIIRTPTWLWFFQAPFPSFAFFLISMFIIILLANEAALLKTVINYLSNKKT